MTDIVTEEFHLMSGDCFQRLKELEDNSVDLVFTSPPYNMNLRVRNGEYCSRQITKEFSTKYEGFADNLPMEEYLEFSRNIVNECLRVSPLVFYNVQFITGNKRALFKLIGEFSDLLKEIIIWDKVNGQPAMQQQVLNSQYEIILVFDSKNAITRQFNTAPFARGTLSNLWSIKRGKKPVKTHGAVFPVELAEAVITNFSVEGATVLDPFMGTGTTGVAAIANNRKFKGVELSPEYYGVSCGRIIEELYK